MTELTYFAPIQQEPFNGLMDAISRTSGDILINFSSEGGNVDVGFRMYNYLITLKQRIIMVNQGDVASSGIVVFLAGEQRLGAEHCKFLIHRLASESNVPASLYDLKGRKESLLFDIERYNQLFKQRTNGAQFRLDILDALSGGSEIILDNSAAIGAGLISRSV